MTTPQRARRAQRAPARRQAEAFKSIRDRTSHCKSLHPGRINRVAIHPSHPARRLKAKSGHRNMGTGMTPPRPERPLQLLRRAQAPTNPWDRYQKQKGGSPIRPFVILFTRNLAAPPPDVEIHCRRRQGRRHLDASTEVLDLSHEFESQISHCPDHVLHNRQRASRYSHAAQAICDLVNRCTLWAQILQHTNM